MKSIMQEKTGQCYLCMKLHDDYSVKQVQEHHVIFGQGKRKLSEKYGLKVYLCLYHHTAGPEAVHQNAELAGMLKARAQRRFKERFPDLDWMQIFQKNYDMEGSGTEGTDADECNEKESGRRQQASERDKRQQASGFMLLEEENEEDG